MISGIILAAGDSKRMGKTKALLDYKGKTFIENIFIALRENKVLDRIIVLGSNEKEVLSNWTPSGEKTVLNKNPEGGQISSFRVGLKNANPESEAVLIALVDQPTIETETYKKIIDFWLKNRDCIIIPKVKRPKNVVYPKTPKPYPPYKRGHPIIIP
ncbi:MAG: nucleotidyltransferase family protein, partial [Elusimicrobiota bacterium]|nr:nucleotidyltransferase family protein [Elusimicrobiota bacterium]